MNGTDASIITLLLCIIGLVILLYYFLDSDFDQDDPILKEVSRRFSVINKKYGKIPLRKGSSSYTEDKKCITLCIYDAVNKKHYDINTIMYVALHELAHVESKNSGLWGNIKGDSHGEEFMKNFDNLLKIAAVKGVYDPSKPMPDIYCGVN